MLPNDAVLRNIAQTWRAGQRDDARSALDAELVRHPDDAALLGLAGLLACEAGDTAAGAVYLRRALAIDPTDPATRINLLTALISLDLIEEAAAVGRGADTANPKVARLMGYVAQQQGRHDDAVRLYSAAVAAMPGDARTWNNLGNARDATNDLIGAMAAFREASRLQPTDPAPRVNAAKALAKAGHHGDRLRWMRAAVADIPADRDIQVESGLAEATERHFDAAEAAFRRAIELDPAHPEAYLELGLLLENLNRIDDLDALVTAAHQRGVEPRQIALIAAWLARRRGQWQLAAERARDIDEAILPLRRHHLLADIADRMGDAATAFAEFEAMNVHAQATAPAVTAPTYREQIAGQTVLLAREGVAAIGPAATERTRRAPAFIIGFPRSGTTLLDTLLMNDARFHVMEELPILPIVEEDARRHAGGELVADANAMRRLYFDTLDDIAPAPSGTQVIDKHPLHMGRIPLLHRVFPEARVVMVERHPCDVVLSCFMANFQLNHAMRHFTSLSEAASLYDTIFSDFERAIDLLPIKLHRIRYEDMVDDLEGQLRPLMEFLGVSWNPAVLDNQASAAGRGHIRTASYSQVTEPIYRRAAGRWERYRPQMDSVLPLLAPWCERMGYRLD